MRVILAWAVAMLAAFIFTDRANAGPSTVALAGTDGLSIATLIAPGSPSSASPEAAGTATPTFTWTAVPEATGYAIWVGEISGGAAAIYTAYMPGDAGCGGGSATCAAKVDRVLADGSTYAWYVLTFTAGGEALWSQGLYFVVRATAPVGVTLIGPGAPIDSPPPIVSTASPIYQWYATAGASAYSIWIGEIVGGNVIAAQYSTYTPEEAHCATGTGICWVGQAGTLNGGSTYAWQILASAPSGDAPWSPGLYFAMAATPVRLLSPGTPPGTAPEVVNSTTPMYLWSGMASATGYTLWVGEITSTGLQGVGYQAYTPAVAGCVSAADICSAAPSLDLKKGRNYIWQIRPSTAIGDGPWGDGLRFSVSAALPPAMATLLGPGVSIGGAGAAMSPPTPFFAWTPVTDATTYVLKLSENGVTVFFRSYSAGEAGCAGGSGGCSVTLGGPLLVGHTYTWEVMSSNTAGDGPWSASLTFTVVPPPSQPPGTVSLVAPQGPVTTSTPTFVWNAVPAATSYQLWIGEGSVGVAIVTATAAVAGCNSGSGTCSMLSGAQLASGHTYNWYVMPVNEAGMGAWSAGLAFFVGPLVPPPAPVAQISPGAPFDGTMHKINPTSLAYRWYPVPGATGYVFSLLDKSTGAPRETLRLNAASAYCASGICQISLPTPLEDTHTYAWTIAGSSAAGDGPTGTGLEFTADYSMF